MVLLIGANKHSEVCKRPQYEAARKRKKAPLFNQSHQFLKIWWPLLCKREVVNCGSLEEEVQHGLKDVHHLVETS